MTAAHNLAVRRAWEIAEVELIDENGRCPGYDHENVSAQRAPMHEFTGMRQRPSENAERHSRDIAQQTKDLDPSPTPIYKLAS